METTKNCIARLSIVALALTMVTIFSPVLAQNQTTEIASAADKFLATLKPEQRQKMLYSYDDADQRTRRSNFPKGSYGASGLAATGNVPDSRLRVISWIDESGTLWFVGGLGFDSAGNQVR
jgi:hypothetical protein